MLRNEFARRFQRAVLVAIGGALILTACDGMVLTAPRAWPDDFVLDGYWEGEIRQGRFEMTLHQAVGDESVTGVGAWIPLRGSRAFRVEGVASESAGVITLLLELSPTSFSPGQGPVFVHYRARPWGHNQMRGRLNGGGFDDTLLSLRRTRPR